MRGMDIAIVLVVLLVLVLMWRGPKTLPRLGEAFGQAIRGARRAVDERDREDHVGEDRRVE